MDGESELFEALEALLKAEKELKTQRRALFPLVLARRKATSRVLAVYRALKGEAAAPPDANRPILEAIERGPASRPVVVEEIPEAEVLEELPDGSPAAPVISSVARPPEGWGSASLAEAAARILGKNHSREAEADLVVCRREWCGAMRYLPHGERKGSKCLVCHSTKLCSYLESLTAARAEELAGQAVDRAAAKKRSTPKVHAIPMDDDRVASVKAPKGRKRKETAAS